LEESSAEERGMEGLDKGGQGPISGCCTIEEEEGVDRRKHRGSVCTAVVLGWLVDKVSTPVAIGNYHTHTAVRLHKREIEVIKHGNAALKYYYCFIMRNPRFKSRLEDNIIL
jgi:hypothetical protein